MSYSYQKEVRSNYNQLFLKGLFDLIFSQNSLVSYLSK